MQHLGGLSSSANLRNPNGLRSLGIGHGQFTKTRLRLLMPFVDRMAHLEQLDSQHTSAAPLKSREEDARPFVQRLPFVHGTNERGLDGVVTTQQQLLARQHLTKARDPTAHQCAYGFEFVVYASLGGVWPDREVVLVVEQAFDVTISPWDTGALWSQQRRAAPELVQRWLISGSDVLPFLARFLAVAHQCPADYLSGCLPQRVDAADQRMLGATDFGGWFEARAQSPLDIGQHLRAVFYRTDNRPRSSTLRQWLRSLPGRGVVAQGVDAVDPKGVTGAALRWIESTVLHSGASP
jgi:hypothetical protein